MGETHSRLVPFFPPKWKIRNYTILHKVGSGSFGTVYAAKTTTSPSKKVAIKIQRFDANPYSREDCLKEVQFLQQTVHIDQTISIIESFSDDERHYIVQELCEEGSLEEYLDKHGPFEPAIAIELFEQICIGVKQLHDIGIIHRDLKPLNILVKKENKALKLKIIDFGLSKKAEIFYSISCTREFAAPEYFVSYYDALKNKTTDVWALGCIFYCMLTCSKPFYQWDDEEGWVLDIPRLKKAKIRLDKVKDSDCRKLIRLCVQKDPLKRIDASSLLKVSRG
jgi:serine/threonine-protein kinase